MERETKEITTPGGKKIVVKTYLTAGEVNSIMRDMFKNETLVAEQGKLPAQRFSALVGIERNFKLVLAAVVEVDGSKENLSQRLEDLPMTEYTAILNQVSGLAEGNF